MVTNNPMRHLQDIGRWSGFSGRTSAMVGGPAVILFAALTASSCAPPEPKALLRVSEVETYWVLDPSRTEKRFLAPAVRFYVENISSKTLLAVDASATFFRDGSTQPWGSGFFPLTERRQRVAPGARVLVTMSSDARYTTEGAPENAFANPNFKPVSVKFFLKVGSSLWVEFGKAAIENAIGSRDARAVLSRPGEYP